MKNEDKVNEDRAELCDAALLENLNLDDSEVQEVEVQTAALRYMKAHKIDEIVEIETEEWASSTEFILDELMRLRRNELNAMTLEQVQYEFEIDTEGSEDEND